MNPQQHQLVTDKFGHQIRHIGHDMNNVLAGLNGFSEILMMRLADNQNLMSWLSAVNENSKKIFTLTQQLSSAIKDIMANSTESNQQEQLNKMRRLALQISKEVLTLYLPLLNNQETIKQNISSHSIPLSDKQLKLFNHLFELLERLQSLQEHLQL